MKKVKYIVVLVLVILTPVILAACGHNGISFNIGYEASDVAIHDLEVIVESEQEWGEIVSTNNYLSALDDKYSEDFFNNNSLIIFEFTTGDTPARLKINRITNEGNELYVEAVDNSGSLAAVSTGIIIIEVKKSEVKSADSLRVQIYPKY